MDWEKGRSLENIRVHSPEAGAWEDELRTFKDVYDVEMFGPPGRFCNLHVVTQTPMFALLLRRLNLMWRLPINFRDGVSTWVVIGTEENIRRLEEELRSQSLDVVIEHVHHKSGEKGRALLTHRQADIFRKAMAAGYFEVPRHITLTELADQQGMAVSSLSEILAVVEKKILQEAQAAFLT
jgi:predicted DNA binding protein